MDNLTFPPTIEGVKSRLRAYAKHANLTNRALAAQAGINESVIRDFWNDGWNPTSATLSALERVVPADWPSAVSGKERKNGRTSAEAAR